MRFRAATTLVALCVVASVVAPPVAASVSVHDAMSPSWERTAATADAPVTEIRTYDRTPSTQGSVNATLRYELDADVGSLCINLPREATDVNTTGFVASGGYCTRHWDGETETPSVSFTLPVETPSNSAPGPHIETDDWAFAEAHVAGRFRLEGDDWTDFTKRSIHENSIDRRVRFAGGAGAASESAAIMGPTRTVNWSGDGEQFRVVTPKAGDVPLDRYRSVLVSASRDLRVGNRHNATVFAFPDGVHAGKVTNEGILVPHADGNFETTRHTWIHEYVHTRQRGTYPGDRMEWFVEASATYYDLRLAVEQDEADYESFREAVAADRYTDDVLTNRSTWPHGGVPYELGPHELAALDARIRTATNGTRTFDDVFYLLNRRTGDISYAEFEQDVATVAGRPLDDWLGRYLTTSETPPIPESGNWLERPSGPRNFDGDNLSTPEEKRRGLNPFEADSNGDGVRDGETRTTTRTTTTSTPTRTTTSTTATDSERSSTDTATDPSASAESDGGSPGFGVLSAVVALLGVALWRRAS